MKKTIKDAVEFYNGVWPHDNWTTIWWAHDNSFQLGDTLSPNTVCTREQFEAYQWDGEGLPPVGCKVVVHNDIDATLIYGHDVIGKEVTVKSLFKVGSVDVAAVASDVCCYCFRVDMLKPVPSERDKMAWQLHAIINPHVPPNTCYTPAPEQYAKAIDAGWRPTK